MKNRKMWQGVCFAIGAGIILGAIYPGKEKAEEPLGPYLFVSSEEADLDQIPHKATSVNVTISGAIAEVEVHQVYENKGQTPVEAIYVFPASTPSAFTQ